MKTLANMKLNLKNQNEPSRSRYARCMRGIAIALITMTLFAPCFFIGRKASASDFHFHFKDNKTGDSFFINALTGDYLLFSDTKHGYLAGRGKLTTSDCLMELRDSGTSAKRPDRDVHFVYNLCNGTAKAEGQILATGEAFAVNDNQMTDSERDKLSTRENDATNAVIEPRPDGRGEPICIQDDAQNYLQVNLSLSYTGDNYFFIDKQKGIDLKGETKAVLNGCKITLTDFGEDPKHPDRRVIIEYNSCTYKANVFVWIAETGKTYVIYDSDVRNNQNCSF